MKIIVNKSIGGCWCISGKACEMYEKRTGHAPWRCDDSLRSDKVLVEIVEELGEEATDPWLNLQIVEVPDKYNWYIENHSGYEDVVYKVKESYLRELIRKGNEDDIVGYVLKANEGTLK